MPSRAQWFGVVRNTSRPVPPIQNTKRNRNTSRDVPLSKTPKETIIDRGTYRWGHNENHSAHTPCLCFGRSHGGEVLPSIPYLTWKFGRIKTVQQSVLLEGSSEARARVPSEYLWSEPEEWFERCQYLSILVFKEFVLIWSIVVYFMSLAFRGMESWLTGYVTEQWKQDLTALACRAETRLNSVPMMQTSRGMETWLGLSGRDRQVLS